MEERESEGKSCRPSPCVDMPPLLSFDFALSGVSVFQVLASAEMSAAMRSIGLEIEAGAAFTFSHLEAEVGVVHQPVVSTQNSTLSLTAFTSESAAPPLF